MTSSHAPPRPWRLLAAGCAAAAALCGALGAAALSAVAMIVHVPQRDRPYGWLTDRLLEASGQGLLILAAAAALTALVALAVPLGSVRRRRRTHPSDG